MDLRVQGCGQSMMFNGRCFISDTLENSITLFCGHLLYSEISMLWSCALIRKLLFILVVYVSIVLTGVSTEFVHIAWTWFFLSSKSHTRRSLKSLLIDITIPLWRLGRRWLMRLDKKISILGEVSSAIGLVGFGFMNFSNCTKWFNWDFV